MLANNSELLKRKRDTEAANKFYLLSYITNKSHINSKKHLIHGKNVCLTMLSWSFVFGLIQFISLDQCFALFFGASVSTPSPPTSLVDGWFLPAKRTFFLPIVSKCLFIGVLLIVGVFSVTFLYIIKHLEMTCGDFSQNK